MLEIDGSIGYGQVLRTAIGLSALMLKPVRIINIRKNRPKPGLMPQHLAGVKAAGEFCNAEINGVAVGSTEIEFVPHSHKISDKVIDIGTAGSIPLLLQSILPLLIFSKNNVSLEIKGGTAGLGAPTIEYTKFVTSPILSLLGTKQPEINILKQGFYPRGGGLVKVNFSPTKHLKAVKILERGDLNRVRGISVVGSLPIHISERQSAAAEKVLKENGVEGVKIESFSTETFSRGTSITLWAECRNSILGSDEIGKIGKPAEKVGAGAARQLVSSIKSGKALDKYMSDQIIPFIALARGRSEITIEDFTEHVETSLMATEKFLGVKFDVDRKEKKISVEGVGYEGWQ